MDVYELAAMDVDIRAAAEDSSRCLFANAAAAVLGGFEPASSLFLSFSPQSID